ncbi:amiloride-sensitive sodium channel subunit beta-like [Lingula anatina]|uniref:Amiloride-sensitive sodium channel subunit beta-like n=1 Tax=Lingula anatina TaxID=7574 RepID=A0A1S3K9N5_LINAN|nr:amiloride-sensitive sodium channel subunit beta-like [Lingula anatina]|eukprot:XP_013418966.1 amiloride-sensitive sodium channel subunit beta-like [Lingula anatina]
MKSCVQTVTIEECGCSLMNCPNPNKTRLCAINTNSTDYECTQRMHRQLASRSYDACSCPQRCSENLYHLTVSSATWPSQSYRESAFLRKEVLSAYNSTLSPAENLLKLEIYISDINVMKIEEHPSYLAANLFADVGGLAGFYIGASVFTAGEFFEFAMDLVIAFIYHRGSCRVPRSGQRKKGSEEHDLEQRTTVEQYV